jgi:hypothetical protein
LHFIPAHQVRITWPCYHSLLITQLHSPSLHFIDIHPVSSYFIPCTWMVWSGVRW